MAGMSDFLTLFTEEGEAFEKMLGRLTVCWAEAEYNIYQTLLHYARVPDPIGRAIFSGDRAKPMREAITAILENTNAPPARRTDFAYVSAQLGSIQTMRDLVTHYVGSAWASLSPISPLGPFLAAPQRLISNVARVKRKQASVSYEVDSAMLGLMCRDLRLIGAHLDRHRAKGRFKPHGPPEPSAWRYKFPQPVSRRKPTPPKTPTQLRPPKSSRA